MTSFDCQKKLMFGSKVYFVNNNMMCGVHQDDIFIRLLEQDKEEILSLNDEVSPFEPMKGRTMKQYVVLPESLYNEFEKLDEWLERSYKYVSSLPLKEPKKKKS
ncbi:MAG: TfoX/Sxy family protein [Methanosarcinaceae archaeon]|nr:TfoX/Sxy family protein [Methanosarcinaceae archaeon]MDF1534705.1 TfoX/Sxy family protein [Methanosarcinaceae archaeon]